MRSLQSYQLCPLGYFTSRWPLCNHRSVLPSPFTFLTSPPTVLPSGDPPSANQSLGKAHEGAVSLVSTCVQQGTRGGRSRPHSGSPLGADVPTAGAPGLGCCGALGGTKSEQVALGPEAHSAPSTLPTLTSGKCPIWRGRGLSNNEDSLVNMLTFKRDETTFIFLNLVTRQSLS